MTHNSIFSTRFTVQAVATAALLLLVGCDGDSTGPDPDEVKDESELTFVRFEAAAQGNVPLQASLWAVRGEDR